ncbi:MAG: hypothetical protein V2I43_20345 [Parvularcula sp.]|nr:hypothetical protein [Parvularcula sp.]
MRKAPGFDEAKAQIEHHVARSGKIPSVRALKAACGGAGSNETYQQFIERWKAERMQSSGILSTLIAIKGQVEAHAQIINTMIEQVMRPAALIGEPTGDGDQDDDAADNEQIDVDDVPEPAGEGREIVPAASHARLTDQPTACDDEPSATAAETAPTADGPNAFTAAAPPAADRTRSADEIDALAENFGLHAEARFLPPDEEDDAAPEANTDGEHEESRSAPVPTAEGSPDDTNTSLSRSNGGSQQAAFPFEPTKPDTGESDTNGGSANGTA